MDRYILKAEHEDRLPFISGELAHFNMTFSCITYLNTSLYLLPQYSTNDARMEIVVRGFHGLQFYASRYWYHHLLAYAKLLDKQKSFPPELLDQLQLLLSFRKQVPRLSSAAAFNGDDTSVESADLKFLDQLPDIQAMALDVIIFRTKINKEDNLNKSLDGKFIGWGTTRDLRLTK